MSYTEEKDEIDKLFGFSKEKSAEYAKITPKEELPGDPVRKPEAAPVSRPATTTQPAAQSAEVLVPDEELVVYEESDAPDFSGNDFISFDDHLPPVKEQQIVLPEEMPAVEKSTIADKITEPPVPEKAESKARPIQVNKEKVDRSKLDFTSDSHLQKNDAKDLLLDSRNLVKIYDGRTVVNKVSINVKRGEIVGLLGPNGAGKTTSFYMMVGLVPANAGQVFFDGKDVTKKPMYIRARLGMGYLPQEESIFRKLTVEQNIMAVMETLKISRKERKERTEALLERFSITHIRNNIALTCSGGEKRRVTIARSLVTEPSLIMLDEPFSGVDPIAVNEIQTIVEELRESGLAILITDHNARQTLELVDRAYLIFEGQVLREGSQEFLVNDPVSRELYLGDRFTM